MTSKTRSAARWVGLSLSAMTAFSGTAFAAGPADLYYERAVMTAAKFRDHDETSPAAMRWALRSAGGCPMPWRARAISHGQSATRPGEIKIRKPQGPEAALVSSRRNPRRCHHGNNAKPTRT